LNRQDAKRTEKNNRIAKNAKNAKKNENETTDENRYTQMTPGTVELRLTIHALHKLPSLARRGARAAGGVV